ncbi:MAG: IS5 family transposase [Candidatus Thorarchaeota archaeon]|nr:MAG: IS5 family transposase [Candidatus Thorarchaeota archaeon]
MPKNNFSTKQNEDFYYVKFTKILYKYFEIAKFLKYFSKYSKEDYDNWQYFTLQTFRQKLKLKYRPFIDWLESCTPLMKFLKLKHIPHYTKLQDFDRRCNIRWHHSIIESTPKVVGLKKFFVGIDGSGFSIYQGSKHYCCRIGRKTKKKDFVKVMGASDMRHQLVLAVRIRKKSRHDNVDFRPLMRKVRRKGKIDVGVGDKAFDAEKNHKLMRDELGALFIAPLRNEEVPVWRTKGEYRKKLKRYFPKKTYNQRSKKETVISVVKRCYGDTVYSTKFSNQKKEICYKVIAYNVDKILKKRLVKNI